MRCTASHLPLHHWWGYGGEHLARAGVKLVEHLERFSTSGVLETAGRLPRNLALLGSVAELVTHAPPAVGVLVDYPDFNFLVGTLLGRAGSRVVYLLPPQVWAWRRGRVDAMRSFVDAVAVGFDFEVEIYRAAGLNAEFIGHPLGLLPCYRSPLDALPSRGHHVALLPGSRSHEVARVLPLMLQTARLLRRRHPQLRFVLGRVPAVEDSIYGDILTSMPLEGLEVVDPHLGDDGCTGASMVLECASAAIVGAGTATLEAALLGVPSVVVTRLSRVTWELVRRMVRVPWVAMPSILLGRQVFIERLQDEADPETLAADVQSLLESAPRSGELLEIAQQLREQLFRVDTPQIFASMLADR